ncbi:MAG: outer membrane beta-barrel protein [Acetobacteraceae bacterium]
MIRRAPLLLALLVLLAAPARAQLDPAGFTSLFPADIRAPGQAPGVTVLSRARPEYAPLPLRLGPLLARPSLDLGFGYDTDPAGLPGQHGSPETLLAPSLALAGGWEGASLAIALGAADHRRTAAPALDYTDWTAGTGLRLGDSRTRLTLSAVSRALHEDGSTIGALPTDRPLAWHLTAARAALRWGDGIVSLTPALDFAAFRYADAVLGGVGLSQADRDRNLLRPGLTARYALDPGTDLVVSLRDTITRYTAPTAGQPSRDSNAVTALAGFQDGADPMLRWRLLAGWETRHFAGYGTRSGPVLEAQAIWQPDGMTTVIATLARRMEDAAQEGVAGYTATSGALRLDREAWRNLILSASLGAEHAAFTDGTHEDAGSAGFAARWLLNRWMRVTASESVTALEGATSVLLPGGRRVTRSVSLLRLGFGW